MSGRTEGGAWHPPGANIMTPENDAAARYFSAITAALSGLEVFMRDDRSPLYRHGIVAKIVAEYIARLDKSFAAGATGWASWTRSAFRAPKAVFRCSRTCSNWKTTAARPTAGLPTFRWPASCARRWPTSSCATRNSPKRCRSRWPSGSISRTSRASRLLGRSRWRRRPRSRSIRRRHGPIISSIGRLSTAAPTCRWSIW